MTSRHSSPITGKIQSTALVTSLWAELVEAGCPTETWLPGSWFNRVLICALDITSRPSQKHYRDAMENLGLIQVAREKRAEGSQGGRPSPVVMLKDIPPSQPIPYVREIPDPDLQPTDELFAL